MYIDSEEEQELDYFSGSAGEKNIFPLSPLQATQIQDSDKRFSNEGIAEERKSEGFYAGDSTDHEKVVHCSVISSGR